MGAQCHACIGGTVVREDIHKLQSSTVHVVVGTPGRVHDMINRRALGKCSKTCVKLPPSKRPEISFQDQLSLNAGQSIAECYFQPTF